MVSLKSLFLVEFETKNIFLKFVYLVELSRFKFSCEHGICCSLLLTFTVIFIFSMKIFIKNFSSRQKRIKFLFLIDERQKRLVFVS